MLLFICDCAEMVDLPVQCFFFNWICGSKRECFKKRGGWYPTTNSLQKMSANLTVHYRVNTSTRSTQSDLCASGYWYIYKHLSKSNISVLQLSNLGQGTG